MSENNIALSFENINFSYGKNSIIKDFSLDIEEGSFTTLLGPSGCGKTTLLRLANGFIEPTSGTIKIDGQIQNGLAPNLRNISYVFQDYALFPHLTVKQNILYGLELKNKKQNRFKKISRMQKFEQKEFNMGLLQEKMRTLGLVGLLDRYPHELSGGQQQRVALARSLILEPKILLMDEPLSSLDSKLRQHLREELKELQQRFKITTLYVTHDQEEALSLSDKIAVIDHGKLLQQGTARELYYSPVNKLAADFTGNTNYFKMPDKTIMIRSEWFTLSKTDSDFSIGGKIISSSFLGSCTRYKIQCTNAQNEIFSADLPNNTKQQPVDGDYVVLYANRIVEM